jgi:CheY-like chemotaxis protein
MKKCSYGLIFMDCSMPVMDRYEIKIRWKYIKIQKYIIEK